MSKRGRKRGFIVEQLIFSLFICSMFLMILVNLFSVLSKVSLYRDEFQDEISLAQLRRVMNVCYDKSIQSNQVSCRYKGETVKLTSNDNHLYLSPGTWIFLSNVDDVSFFEKNGMLFLTYKRENFTRKAVLSNA